jgi:hypothetical protein
LLDDQQQTDEVAADPEVVEVTLDASLERLVLSRDRKVSMATTPIVDGAWSHYSSYSRVLAHGFLRVP